MAINTRRLEFKDHAQKSFVKEAMAEKKILEAIEQHLGGLEDCTIDWFITKTPNGRFMPVVSVPLHLRQQGIWMAHDGWRIVF